MPWGDVRAWWKFPQPFFTHAGVFFLEEKRIVYSFWQRTLRHWVNFRLVNDALPGYLRRSGFLFVGVVVCFLFFSHKSRFWILLTSFFHPEEKKKLISIDINRNFMKRIKKLSQYLFGKSETRWTHSRLRPHKRSGMRFIYISHKFYLIGVPRSYWWISAPRELWKCRTSCGDAHRIQTDR